MVFELILIWFGGVCDSHQWPVTPDGGASGRTDFQSVTTPPSSTDWKSVLRFLVLLQSFYVFNDRVDFFILQLSLIRWHDFTIASSSFCLGFQN